MCGIVKKSRAVGIAGVGETQFCRFGIHALDERSFAASHVFGQGRQDVYIG